MSFYGSVYYQLIDTFYKVVLRNKGVNNTGFLDENKIPAWSESQAVGRKGVFGFDSGNRWINLNTYVENPQDSNDQYSIYEIYHGAPDPEATGIANGFKALLDEAQLKEQTGEDGVIQLDYGDAFETYETKFDKAGHIAVATKKTYRLPKDEEDKRLGELEKLVGKDTNRTLPNLEKEEDRNLYGYVEENTKDVAQLEKYVGDWTKSTTYWNWGNQYAPTIVQAIGNLDDMYDDYSQRAQNHKTLSQIIGNLPNLWKKFGNENFISLSDIMLQQQSDISELESYTTGQVNVLTDAVGNIGTRPDGYDKVYTELTELHELVSNLDTNYKAADSDLNTSLSKDIDNVESKANNNTEAIGVINNTTIPGINGAIDLLKSRVDEHYNSWIGTEKTLQDKDSELAADIGELESIVSNNYSTLDGKINTLSNSIGVLTEGSTVVKMIKDGDDALQNKIESISADLGVKPGNSSAFEAINQNAQDIADINNYLGTVKEQTIAEQFSAVDTKITEANTKIGDLGTKLIDYAKLSELNAHAQIAEQTYATKTSLEEYAKSSVLEDYAKIESLSAYVTTEDLEENYSLKTEVTAINNKVDGVIDQMTLLGEPVDFSEKLTEDRLTLLAEIFAQLEQIKIDIAGINARIDELHPIEEDLEPEPTPEDPAVGDETE